MKKPQTILEISKQTESEIDWNQAALVLIDIQNEYTTGNLTLGDGAQAAIANVNKLLTHAREVNAPIFHVVHHGNKSGQLFNPHRNGSEIVSEIEVRQQEAIVIKSLPNAFTNTNLQELIELSDRRVLVIVGFMSHMCVSSTTRGALDLGFTNYVCDDACYTRDLRSSSGETIPSEIVHLVSMAALKDRFATVCSTSKII